MKLKSVFNGRLYTMPTPSESSKNELKLINTILSKTNPDFRIDKIDLLEVGEDYDTYILTSGEEIMSLKFSLDGSSENFLNEIENTKNLSTGSIGKFISGGKVKIGEDFLYLLCKWSDSEPITEIGRSQILNEKTLTSLIRSYKSLHNDPFVPSSHNLLFNIEDYMGQDQIEAINSHSDFEKISSIVNSLKFEHKKLSRNLVGKETGIILSEISPSQIHVSSDGVKFSDLRFLRNDHFYSDVANIIITFGLSKNQAKFITSSFEEEMGVSHDKGLYKKFHKRELYKKALSLIFRYFKEVYLYESQRMHEILSIINDFALSYEELCKLQIIYDNKDFIRSNITEPILGEPLK